MNQDDLMQAHHDDLLRAATSATPTHGERNNKYRSAGEQQPQPAPARCITPRPKASSSGGVSHMRVHRRVPMLALSALLAALSLTFTGTASAQTSFQASVTSTGTRPAGPCSNGAYICGTANIAGYGAASWNMFVTSATPVVSPCGSTYTATTDFTLVSDPDSTLVLDEGGPACGLGHDGAAILGYFKEGSKAFGHPFAFAGSWAVDPASTGQFGGLTGSGTDRVNVAGAHAAGSYSGTLG